jgi:SPP1 gp7 family putative phage head morphogenesis protein
MDGLALLATIDAYDRAMNKAEEDTIYRVNQRLVQALDSINSELTTYYEGLYEQGSLAAQMQVRRSEELGNLLSRIDPEDDSYYREQFNDLIEISNRSGTMLAEELISSYQPESLVGSFATIPYAAIANQATQGLVRLSRHTDAFKDTASGVIELGLIQGKGANWMQKQLQQQLNITKKKAEDIARTEASSALNAAAEQRYAAAGITKVQLLITPSQNVCPFCAARNGAVFDLGKIKVPQHVRCRCMLVCWDDAWADAGLVDEKFVINYHNKGIAELRKNGLEPDYDGAAPFERANKLPVPKLTWTPRGKDAAEAREFKARTTAEGTAESKKAETKKTTGTKTGTTSKKTTAKKAAEITSKVTKAKTTTAAKTATATATKAKAAAQPKAKAEPKAKAPAKPKLTADQKFIQKYSEQTKSFRAKNNELKKQLADGQIDDRKYRKERDKISSAIQKQTKEIEAELMKRLTPVPVSVGTKHGMSVAENFLRVRFDDIDFHATEYKPGFPAIDDLTEWIQDGWFPDSLKKHTKNVYWSNQRNKRDEYWEIKYNIPNFTSAATGGDGDVVVYNGEMLGHGSAAHEMAHNLANVIYGDTTPPRTSDFGKAAFNTKSPTEYGNSSDAEDFAESMRLYIRINNGLENESTKDFRENYPDRYRIMQKLIDDPNYKG